jgi:hypothetical protein
MRKLSALGLALAVTFAMADLALAVDKGKAIYIGGTIASIKEKTQGPINLKDEAALFYMNGQLTIPWEKISEVEYGQKVGHRVATAILLSPLALFKKARHHYVTLNYTDKESKDQAVVFEFDKNDIRPALAILRARTGKEVSYLDDEAKKQMGGGGPPKEKEKEKQ